MIPGAFFTMKSQIGIARSLLIFSAAFLLSAIAPTLARAGFTFTVESVTATAGSMDNTLNVTLTNTGPTAVTIGGFAFEISGGSGVTFTSVDISTTPTYIFAGNSGFGPDISNQPPNLPGNMLAALDFYATFGSGTTLASGSTVGMGDVHFNLASTATGPISITFSPLPGQICPMRRVMTSLSRPGPRSRPGQSPSIRAPVPEPSSLAMTAIALAIGLVSRQTRCRAS